MSAEMAARVAAAVAVLTDYEAFRDGGAPARDGRDLAWAYWADRLAGMLSLVLAAGPGPLEQLGAEAVLRQIEQIRLVVDSFNWEHDDLQYALEQIEAILAGDGQ